MKLFWVGSIVFLILFTASALAACPPVVGDPLTGSQYGRGGVQICGIDYMCGAADYVCPEEFNDSATGTLGNCSACPDPDCQGFLNGTVYDNTTGTPVPLQGANVSVFFSFLPHSAYSDVNGYYSMFLTSGLHTISASKKGYDTQTKEVFVKNRKIEGDTNDINFYLPLGVCHADCTNEFNRCNPSCEGYSVVNASGSLDVCHFDPDPLILQACTNKVKDTEVYLGPFNETHSYFANCCEGSKYLKYHPKPTFSCSGDKGFVKSERVVQYQGKPIKLIVAVCR